MMGIIKRALQRRALEKDLNNLLNRVGNSEFAPQAILRLYLEIRDKPRKKDLLKKLRKVFSRLSYTNDIFPTLAWDNSKKIPQSDKIVFWKMVLKFGVDSSRLFTIVLYSDYFFAEKAFDELLERCRRGRVSKEQMRHYLVQITITRQEFNSKAWSEYKNLSQEIKPSYDDLRSISLIARDEKLQSPQFIQITEEARQMSEKYEEVAEKMTTAISQIRTIIEKINELNG